MLCVPLVVLVPLQPPEAVQEVVFVLDQVSVAEPLEATEEGETVRVTVGVGGVTVTVTLDEGFAPLAPVQVSVNVVVVVSAVTDWLPDAPLVPDQPPEAEQEVVFVDIQSSVTGPPKLTDVLEVLSDTVGGSGSGGGALTAMTAFADPLPTAPLQVSV